MRRRVKCAVRRKRSPAVFGRALRRDFAPAPAPRPRRTRKRCRLVSLRQFHGISTDARRPRECLGEAPNSGVGRGLERDRRSQGLHRGIHLGIGRIDRRPADRVVLEDALGAELRPAVLHHPFGEAFVSSRHAAGQDLLIGVECHADTGLFPHGCRRRSPAGCTPGLRWRRTRRPGRLLTEVGSDVSRRNVSAKTVMHREAVISRTSGTVSYLAASLPQRSSYACPKSVSRTTDGAADLVQRRIHRYGATIERLDPGGASIPVSSRIFTPMPVPSALAARIAWSIGLFSVIGPLGVGWSWVQVTFTTNAVIGPTYPFGGGPSRSIRPWIIGLRFCGLSAVALGLGVLVGRNGEGARSGAGITAGREKHPAPASTGPQRFRRRRFRESHLPRLTYRSDPAAPRPDEAVLAPALLEPSLDVDDQVAWPAPL